MTVLASLDPKDRKLLFICMAVVVALAVITAFFSQPEQRRQHRSQ